MVERKQLSKAIIAERALALIDKDGFEAFSIRRLATSLDVYPTAIYWYIPDRDAVTGEVINLVLKDITPGAQTHDWKNWLRKFFENYRKKIKRHPNVAPIIGAQLTANPHVDFVIIEQLLATLQTAGFEGEKLCSAYTAVMGALVGFTTQEFATVPSDDHDNWAASIQSALNDINAESYPITAKHLPSLRNKSFVLRWENGTTAPLDNGFQMFISSIILGLEAMAKLDP